MRSGRQRRRLRFLITAGGTREYIDAVRFISNASSGRMGYELARAAVCAGHGVTLITAPTNLRAGKGIDAVEVESAREMFEAVRRRFSGCDCLIMAAAVSDYAPIRVARGKIKKSGKVITLKLKPTADILRWAAGHKRHNQLVVGFALEDKNVRMNAARKMREKKLDMVIANTPAAIGSEKCEVWVKRGGSRWQWIAEARKRVVARRLIRLVEQSAQAD